MRTTVLTFFLPLNRSNRLISLFSQERRLMAWVTRDTHASSILEAPWDRVHPEGNRSSLRQAHIKVRMVRIVEGKPIVALSVHSDVSSPSSTPHRPLKAHIHSNPSCVKCHVPLEIPEEVQYLHEALEPSSGEVPSECRHRPRQNERFPDFCGVILSHR
jgi:hypothetical protein